MADDGRVLPGAPATLARFRPEVLDHWAPDPSCPTSPREVFRTDSSWSHRIRLKCPVCGHVSEALPSVIAKRKNMCPACYGRRAVAGVSDLATKRPDLAAMWDRARNGALSPRDVVPGSKKRVWWVCPDCGKPYLAAVVRKAAGGADCPHCSGRGRPPVSEAMPWALPFWRDPRDPSEVSSGTGARARFACSRCGRGFSKPVRQVACSRRVLCASCSKKRLAEAHSKAVVCVETGAVYPSLRAAAEACGLKSAGTVSAAAKGRTETAGGYHWKFAAPAPDAVEKEGE